MCAFARLFVFLGIVLLERKRKKVSLFAELNVRQETVMIENERFDEKNI